MASVVVGRGRGRGILAKTVVDHINKPGGVGLGDSLKEHGVIIEKNIVISEQDPVSSLQDIVLEIQNILDGLSLDISDPDLENLHQLILSAAANEVTIKNIAKIVYDKCTSKRQFATTGACICNKLGSVEISGTKFRSLLLSMIQADYKEKDTIKASSITKFLNVFSFMSQTFGTMRTANGEVFKPLVGPLYDCCNLIIDSTGSAFEEYDCLSEQLKSIGSELEQVDREKMEQLMFKIRAKVIQHGSTPCIRCALLEVIECASIGWKSLSDDVARFYMDTAMDIASDKVASQEQPRE